MHVCSAQRASNRRHTSRSTLDYAPDTLSVTAPLEEENGLFCGLVEHIPIDGGGVSVRGMGTPHGHALELGLYPHLMEGLYRSEDF